MPVQEFMTLVYPIKNTSVLHGFKTRDNGKGLWHGFGGKVKKNETPAECAKRELQEECNLIADVNYLRHIGVVRSDRPYKNSISIIHIFTCSKWEGQEEPSEEMDPIKWYNFSEIPYKNMWPDTEEWYPYVLENKFFSARFTYSDPKTIADRKITEFTDLKSALDDVL